MAFHEGAGTHGRISIVDVQTGEILNQLNGKSTFAWSPDGDQLIYAGRDEDVVRFDLNTGRLEVLFEGFQHISTLDWLQDGRLIFTDQETYESKPTIYLYDIHSRSLATLRADAHLFGVSPGGQRLLIFVETEDKERPSVLLALRLDGVGGEEVVVEGKISTAFWVTDEMVGYVDETEKEAALKVVDLISRESVNLTQRLKGWF